MDIECRDTSVSLDSAASEAVLGTSNASQTGTTAKDWARLYASLGWKVLPIYEMARGGCSCGKASGSGHTEGKHPRTTNGVKDATTDTVQIDSWWTAWPTANIGIATGVESGLVVVDVDPRNGGLESFHRFSKDFTLPKAIKVATGSGGFHLYFKHPGSVVHNRTNLPGYPGIDLKGDGGYVVAAPSNHKSGNHYVLDQSTWMVPETLPQAIVDLGAKDLLPEAPAIQIGAWDQKTPVRVQAILDSTPHVLARFEGSKAGLTGDSSDSGIDFSLACSLARAGLSEDEVAHGVMASRVKRGLSPTKSDAYLPNTVGKALALAADAGPAQGAFGNDTLLDCYLAESQQVWEAALSNPTPTKVFYDLFEPGECHIVAGKSAAGKTAFALWFGGHWAEAASVRGLAGEAPERGLFVYLGLDPSVQELARKLQTYRSYPDELGVEDPRAFGKAMVCLAPKLGHLPVGAPER